LLRIQDAATADLAWFVSSGVASKVAAVASMPARNRISIKIEITIGDLVYRTTFLMNWGVNQ
jgi:phage gp46-like protein